MQSGNRLARDWIKPGGKRFHHHLPSLNSKGGTASAHDGLAIGQRVRKEQPDGLLMGFGTSPVSRIRRSFALSGSGPGIAERSAREYGCIGFL